MIALERERMPACKCTTVRVCVCVQLSVRACMHVRQSAKERVRNCVSTSVDQYIVGACNMPSVRESACLKCARPSDFCGMWVSVSLVNVKTEAYIRHTYKQTGRCHTLAYMHIFAHTHTHTHTHTQRQISVVIIFAHVITLFQILCHHCMFEIDLMGKIISSIYCYL